MKKYFLFLLFIISVGLNAQTSIEFQTGVAKYSMSDLLEWQRGLKELSAQNLSIVDAFPAYYSFQSNILFSHKSLHIGGGFGFFSTGGRLGYWDETGSIVEDQLLNKYAFSLISAYPFLNKRKISLELRSSILISYSDFLIISTVSLFDDSISQEVKFHSLNYSIQPSLDFKWLLTKKAGLIFSLGVEIEPFRQELRLNDNNEVVLGLPNNSRAVKHGWTGIKGLGGFYIIL